MRAWKIYGWFKDYDAEKFSEHTLIVAASSLDAAIDRAVDHWGVPAETKIDRSNVYSAMQVLTLDCVEAEEKAVV
jgi:hypothetical protein